MTHKEAGACACLFVLPAGRCGHRPLRTGAMNCCRGRRPDVPSCMTGVPCRAGPMCPAAKCAFVRRGDVGIDPLRMGAVSRCRGRRPRRPASCHSEPVTASLAWESVSLQEKNGLPRRCAPRSKCPWGTPRNDRLFRSPETDAGRPLFVNLQNPTTKTEEDVV